MSTTTTAETSRAGHDKREPLPMTAGSLRNRWMVRGGALPLVLALFAGLVAVFGPSHNASAAIKNPSSTHAASAQPATMTSAQSEETKSEVALYEAMRSLWEQHMEWTYSTIAAFADSSPGLTATLERLLQNQVDIGNAIKPYYGDAAGAALTVLLKAHINGVVPILQAAKAGDSTALGKAEAAEYANAQAIGNFLARANPKFWPEAAMRQMMKIHIQQTIAYASDLLTGKYAEAIASYGQAESHMLQMADMLSAGIIGAFPNRFAS